MAKGGRSDTLLSGLALIAIANGVLFGLATFALVAIGLRLLGYGVPHVNLAIAFGSLAGLGFLASALHRQRALRECRYEAWGSHRAAEPPTLERFRWLVAKSSLERTPALCVMDSPRPNAFAVGRSEEDSSIVVTTALLDLLDPAELDAVLAHEIAHIESGAIKEVGFADAVVDGVGGIARLRARFLWGPRRTFTETAGVWAVLAVLVAVVKLMEGAGGIAGAALAVVGLVLLVALFYAVFTSFWPMVQLVLFLTFLGPLTAIESALALPTAIVVARLVSRTRVEEADARSVELTGDGDALVSALTKLESSELREADPGFESELRFALFAPPFLLDNRPFPRLYLTHPEIPVRIDAIEAKAREAAPAA